MALDNNYKGDATVFDNTEEVLGAIHGMAEDVRKLLSRIEARINSDDVPVCVQDDFVSEFEADFANLHSELMDVHAKLLADFQASVDGRFCLEE